MPKDAFDGPDSGQSGTPWHYTTNARVPAGRQLPPGVHRFALGIEYDGKPYCGWQRQVHSPSVQETLESALSSVADQPVSLVCAGRTDTGVHATGQVVHFDTQAVRGAHNWLQGVNASVDRSIVVKWATEVPAHFHARFSATYRTYRYLIANTQTRPALLHHGLAWVRDPLDAARMDRALCTIRGERDFSSFRGSGCQSRSPFRCVRDTRVYRRGNIVVIEISANAFLLHMVRNIAGLLLDIGRGDSPENEMLRIVHLRDRTQAGITAPPHGLYLVKVGYPADFSLPQTVAGPDFLAEPLA